MKIAVLGLWHLGEIYSVCLAELGHEVFGVADSKAVVRDFQKGKPPVAEPKLLELLKRNQKRGRLIYTTEYAALKTCDVLWVAFDTPVDRRDRAKTNIVFDAVARAVPFVKNGVLVVVSSQLPVGSSEKLIQKIKKKRPNLVFDYAYVPENLQLGKAVESFLHPSRIVIGAADMRSARTVKKIFQKVKADFLIMNIASAEMVKHALNSFLATSLSFIYDIADVCERVGADVTEVSRALKSDPRIGKGAYLDASIGFSGGTLGRDLSFLISEAKQHSISLSVIEAVLSKNEKRYHRALEALQEALGSIRGKKVAIWGITYKAGTPTLRRSLALSLARLLESNGTRLSFADPLASRNELKKEMGKEHVMLNRAPLQSAKDCHAIIIMTPWKGLERLDFKRLRKTMKRPAFIFDARNFFSGKRALMKEAGLTYRGVGIKEN